MTTPNPALLPCPFCGGEAIRFSMKVSNRHTGNDYVVWHSTMYCNDCNTYGKRIVCHSMEKYRTSDTEAKQFKQEATTAWNTRTALQAAPEVENEWFFRWAARAMADGRYQEAISTIFHHPANPYAKSNPWEK